MEAVRRLPTTFRIKKYTVYTFETTKTVSNKLGGKLQIYTNNLIIKYCTVDGFIADRALCVHDIYSFIQADFLKESCKGKIRLLNILK